MIPVQMFKCRQSWLALVLFLAQTIKPCSHQRRMMIIWMCTVSSHQTREKNPIQTASVCLSFVVSSPDRPVSCDVSHITPTRGAGTVRGLIHPRTDRPSHRWVWLTSASRSRPNPIPASRPGARAVFTQLSVELLPQLVERGPPAWLLLPAALHQGVNPRRTVLWSLHAIALFHFLLHLFQRLEDGDGKEQKWRGEVKQSDDSWQYKNSFF